MKLIGAVTLVVVVFCLVGCASSKPPDIFIPTQTSDVYSFYRNGLPIGSLTQDSTFVMFALEPAEVSHTQYMRLWLLYKNNYSAPYLLEPLKIVKLSIQSESRSFDNLTPDSPSKILADIENEKAVSLITQAIGGSLQALSTQPTTATDQNGNRWVLNDKGEKVNAKLNATIGGMQSTSNLFDIFKSSVNSGIMKKNTIFTGESTNGYIYFPLPDAEGKYMNSRKNKIDLAKSKFMLEIQTESGSKTIDFLPGLGE